MTVCTYGTAQLQGNKFSRAISQNTCTCLTSTRSALCCEYALPCVRISKEAVLLSHGAVVALWNIDPTSQSGD